MASTRPYRTADMDSLYAICLATGDAGNDAARLYHDPKLIGHIYAGPYAALQPDFVLVAEDEIGIAGYVLGVPDTRAWETVLERDWWPRLRQQYPDPAGPSTTWNADERRTHMIHHPERASSALVGDYPAHLHLNLAPRAQGRGIGKALLDVWLASAVDRGVTAVHIGANRSNTRGVAFWTRSGFKEIDLPGSPTRTIWMGRTL